MKKLVGCQVACNRDRFSLETGFDLFGEQAHHSEIITDTGAKEKGLEPIASQPSFPKKTILISKEIRERVITRKAPRYKAHIRTYGVPNEKSRFTRSVYRNFGTTVS